jgi:hypothetical protein
MFNTFITTTIKFLITVIIGIGYKVNNLNIAIRFKKNKLNH